MVQPLHIRGARIWDDTIRYDGTPQRDLYTSDVVLDEPASGALTVDLDGYTIFPGLINAHDHLELNHYPRSKFRERYDNAHQWGEDMNVRLDTEPYKSLRAYPLWDKLFIGGLKNLLCGTTTVAHHNPPHKDLWHKDFPVRVLKKYGWTHSLHFSTDEEIVRSYRSTPPDVPWFIHLAEGTDEVAAGEYKRLNALGCVGENTVFIHGVGLTTEDIQDAAPKIRGLVWCPTTNNYMFGEAGITKAHEWVNCGGLIAFGSDSRLTANGDLLCEENYADGRGIGQLTWLTSGSHQILFGGSYTPFMHGANADFIVTQHLLFRDSIALVVKGGVPQIGDPDVMAKFPHVQTVAATLDGKPKRIHIDLARRIHANQLKEPGLEVDNLPERKFSISLLGKVFSN